MIIRLMSPRRTAPYQTLDSSSRLTSPSTVAPGTIHALEWIVGPFCSRGMIPPCPVGSESSSICIRDECQDGTRSARSQGYGRTRFINLRGLCQANYKIVIERLASTGAFDFDRPDVFENYSRTGNGASRDCALLFCRLELLSGCPRRVSFRDRSEERRVGEEGRARGAP